MDDQNFAETEFDADGRNGGPAVESPTLTIYSDAANRVLDHAAVLARATPAGVLTTEHLLLGLVHEPDNAAARLLTDYAIDIDRLGSAMSFVRGANSIPDEQPGGRSPRVERVLVDAGREAAAQRCDRVDTLHLLLALLRMQQGIAVFALESSGRNLTTLEKSISQRLRDGETDLS